MDSITLRQAETIPVPGPTELVLICARFDELAASASIFDGTLSADEIDRSSRFRRPEDSQRFNVGRGFLRLALGQVHSIPPSRLQFEYSSFGKPGLAEGLAFNLSHTGEYLLLAVGGNGNVGADVEDARADSDPEELASQILSKDEYRVFTGLPQEERRSAFFRAWTIKEAWLKATGKGFSLPPEEVEVLADSSATVGGITGAVWGRHQGFRVACLGIDEFNLASVVFPEITTNVTALKFV